MSPSKGTWEVVEDGYHRDIRFIDNATGRILGGVRGSNYDIPSEWDAHICGNDKPHIGSFVTEAQAKRAVERALAEPESE